MSRRNICFQCLELPTPEQPHTLSSKCTVLDTFAFGRAGDGALNFVISHSTSSSRSAGYWLVWLCLFVSYLFGAVEPCKMNCLQLHIWTRLYHFLEKCLNCVEICYFGTRLFLLFSVTLWSVLCHQRGSKTLISPFFLKESIPSFCRWVIFSASWSHLEEIHAWFEENGKGSCYISLIWGQVTV